MKNSLLSLPLLFLIGCGSEMSSPTVLSSQSALEEVRIALIDVKQSLSRQQMDIELLEEKVGKQKSPTQTASSDFSQRLQKLEREQGKIESDLRQLANHANEMNRAVALLEKQIHQQGDKLGEVAKLKSTLTSINQAIGGGKTYKVQAGDTLDKIARRSNTSVESIKRLNALQSSTIVVGQELRLPE